MSKFEKNLSEGNVAKQLLLFSLPFLISNIIQSLYNVADMVIVGNFSGTYAMSGVNIGGQVTLLVTNLVVGLSAGATVLIGQYLGFGDKKALKETISTLFTALIAIAVFLTLLMLLLRDTILNLINTPPEAFPEAHSYLTITTLGIIFIFGYNAFSAVMRGMGDSRRPLVFVGIACAANIIGDLILVAGFGMGAKGAAIATIASQALSMFLCIIYLKKNEFVFDFKPSSFVISRDRLKKLLQVGVPTSVQNVITSLSFLILSAMVNDIGVTASAAVGAVGKFNSFAILPAIAMSSSVSAMSAQNIGAGKWERAVETMRIGMVVSLSISLVFFVISRLFPVQILSIFCDDETVFAAGTVYMKTFCFDYLFVPFTFCLNGLFIGSGHTAFSLINGAMSSILIRVPAAWLFGIYFNKGLSGIGIGAPFASCAAMMIALAFFFSNKWRSSTIIENV